MNPYMKLFSYNVFNKIEKGFEHLHSIPFSNNKYLTFVQLQYNWSLVDSIA